MLVKERNDCCFVIVSKICALIQGGGVVCNWLKIEFFYPLLRYSKLYCNDNEIFESIEYETRVFVCDIN